MDGDQSIPGGRLEYAVLAAVWDLGVATAREVYDRVGLPLGLVYTTTARVLDRLQAKGLVARDKVGKSFAYRALVARREIDHVRMSRALSGFLADEPRPALASLVDAIEAIDPKLIDELARAVEAPETLSMSRDLVLATLIVALCGSAIWLAGWLPARAGSRVQEDESGRAAERRCSLALWLPLVPAAVALAALAGWALQEPRLTDEILGPLTPLFVAPIAALWLRASWRAGRALAPPSVPPLAATLGLWRPRIAIDERLSRDLDATARQAVLAHEQAHCRHRDPLRIWLAQIASDLQWPSPRAAARFEHWRRALELARDEEARDDGVEGEDLAAALIGAVRLAQRPVVSAGATLVDGEQALVVRVGRLLAPLRAPVAQTWGSRLALAGSLALLAAATIFGLGHGDLLVRALPIVGG